jgi:hypothetical protein
LSSVISTWAVGISWRAQSFLWNISYFRDFHYLHSIQVGKRLWIFVNINFVCTKLHIVHSAHYISFCNFASRHSLLYLRAWRRWMLYLLIYSAKHFLLLLLMECTVIRNVERNQGIIVWRTLLHNFINMELKINYNLYAIVITDSSLTVLL